MTLASSAGASCRTEQAQLLDALQQLPGGADRRAALEPEMAAWAAKFAQCEHALFLGAASTTRSRWKARSS